MPSMSQPIRIILIHGLRGSPGSPPWYPWLAAELSAKGFFVKAPQMPNPAAPKLKEWNETIERELGGDFHNVIFVGHSLGGLAILNALAHHAKDDRARAVLLFGAPVKFAGRPEISEFLNPLDWELIKKRAEQFHVYASHDDKAVPYEHGLLLKQYLAAEFHEFHNKGHFGNENTWAEILAKIGEIATVRSAL